MPEDDPIKVALDQSLERLKELMSVKLRAELEAAVAESQIAKLRPKIVGLAALSDEAPKDEYLHLFLNETGEMGLTSAIKDALMGDSNFMTPLQVRDALIRTGHDITGKYANPLAVIHGILKRLETAEKLITRTTDKGVEYRWNPKARLTRRETRLLRERQPDWFKQVFGTAAVPGTSLADALGFLPQREKESALRDLLISPQPATTNFGETIMKMGAKVIEDAKKKS